MKFNFKPLSSFFSNKAEEENDKTDDQNTGENQGNDQGDDQGDDGDDQGSDQGDEQTKEANQKGKDATISISVKEYKSFVAAQAELEKFGKNAEDRNNFLKDAAQLQEWYEAAAGVGATSNSDANAQEKSTKKLSKVTQEAKSAYEKSASKK